jgi:hypothetical protein
MPKPRNVARKPKPSRRRVRSTAAAAKLPIERWCEDLAVQPNDARQRSVRAAISYLGQLVAMRAVEDGISRTTAWRNIFDLERLHADLDSHDRARREVAERALGALAIMLLRREVTDACNASLRKVRLFELASLARQIANEEIADVVGDSGLDVDPN